MIGSCDEWHRVIALRVFEQIIRIILRNHNTVLDIADVMIVLLSGSVTVASRSWPISSSDAGGSAPASCSSGFSSPARSPCNRGSIAHSRSRAQFARAPARYRQASRRCYCQCRAGYRIQSMARRLSDASGVSARLVKGADPMQPQEAAGASDPLADSIAMNIIGTRRCRAPVRPTLLFRQGPFLSTGAVFIGRVLTRSVVLQRANWGLRWVYVAHRIVEDSTMDKRRIRNDSQSKVLARARWFGWVMLMMFVLVQMAAGSEPSGGQSETAQRVGG
jgi:hypothetical protein